MISVVDSRLRKTCDPADVRRIVQWLAAVVSLSLLAASAALAGSREAITRDNAMLCDDARRVCLRGTLSYYTNPRLLQLRSRVQHADGPGLVKFRLVGENTDGYTRRTTLEVRIRGHYSEIVNKRLITDHPDVYSWRLESIDFEPGPRSSDEKP